jgi:ABC-2 type transport system ATP-binding protein
MIKCGLRLVEPDSGTVSIAGLEPTKGVADQLRRMVGYVPESECFYEWMTIQETLSFARNYYPTWDCRYEEDLLERYQLDGSKKVKHLSKGMRAKLSLILALAFRPKVLVLDEPSSGLDPVMKAEFLDELSRLVAQKHIEGILISSHILSEIAKVAHRIVILQSGRLLADRSRGEMLVGWRKALFSFSAEERTSNVVAGRIRPSADFGRHVLVFREHEQNLLRELELKGANRIEVLEPSLEEVLLEAVTVEEVSVCGH